MSLTIAEYVPLHRYSTFSIGGPARFLVEVSSLDDLLEVMHRADMQSLPILMVGRGSNSLFHDEGFEGIAVVNKIDFFKEYEEGCFQAGAGMSFPLLGRVTAKRGYSGLEFAAGIPGSVGGAVFMNAGASGQETKDSLIQVETVTRGGRMKRYTKEELSFGYRWSIFQGLSEILCSATFQTNPSSSAYQNLQEKIARRMETQPYLDRSIGCIFKNPVGDSAGRLIEMSGMKGYQVGGAQVSTKHANFIVNVGQATASDVRVLALEIVETVFKQFQLLLEPEAKLIGRDGLSYPLIQEI